RRDPPRRAGRPARGPGRGRCLGAKAACRSRPHVVPYRRRARTVRRLPGRGRLGGRGGGDFPVALTFGKLATLSLFSSLAREMRPDLLPREGFRCRRVFGLPPHSLSPPARRPRAPGPASSPSLSTRPRSL